MTSLMIQLEAISGTVSLACFLLFLLGVLAAAAGKK
jgi:hypothetical protein